MSNMHRVQWFDQQIREGHYPNSKQLSEQFEISRRQAQRDIEYLMISLRAPLVYIAKRRGYGYEDKSYVLPHLYMTEEEKQVLKYIAFRYRNYSRDNAKAVSRVAHLLDRLIDEEHTETINRLPVFEADPSYLQHFQLITFAIQQQRIVQITYRDNGIETQLRIHPLRLTSQYATDCLFAYCEQKSMHRTFWLDAIKKLTVMKEHFELASEDSRYGIETTQWTKKPFTAKVELALPVSGDSWNGYPVREIEGLLYEIEFYDTDSFLQHLLIHDWKRLLAPKWLRAKLQAKCSDVLEKCNQSERIAALDING